MKEFLSATGKLILGLFAAYSMAFAISGLWAWFLTPLGVPAIGILHAYGIMLLVGMFTFPTISTVVVRTRPLLDADYLKKVEWITPIVIIIVSWLTVLIGFGASLFM